MTPQQAKQLRDNPVFQAFCEGKEVEYHHASGEWKRVEQLDVHILSSFYCRIKPSAPILRPWKPEEVPVGALIRGNTAGKKNRALIVALWTNAIYLVGVSRPMRIELHEASLQWEHSLDHGKTWLPCGVLE